jgi:RND family efflux transporter MFP subunit
MAGIETLVVKQSSLGRPITAPGEVVLNAYRTTKITPRTPAQVIERHVRLGDHVAKGQPLVTLSSLEMAQAQGELIQTHAELRRVKRLGQKVVSGKRFVTAQIAYQLAYAKVNAYGMTQKQVKSFLRKGDATNATGEFSLLSFQDGTVMSDAFVVGELIEPGQVLMSISDESVLWIEARLTPEDAAKIELGAPARIQVGNQWMSGKVVQARHALDESTRTLSVNIEVINEGDSIHPGQFVQVVIEGGGEKSKQHGIVVPVVAVLRSPDGDWQVFEETSKGVFEPKEVRVLQTVGDQMLIEGIEVGSTIVGKGAFFVQSEMAKGGFDPHNH